MGKTKTKKSVLKRFKITKTGKVMRGSQYARHRRSRKNKRQIRRYKEPIKITYQQARVIKSMITS